LDLAGCTATRPKALVGLQYKDIEFPPLIIIMKLNLKQIKRTGRKRKK
jgi:hypothetical protein